MTDDSSDNSIAVHYTCGKCGLRWKGEKTYEAVGCPQCRNYSTIGVDLDTARAYESRVTRGTKS